MKKELVLACVVACAFCIYLFVCGFSPSIQDISHPEGDTSSLVASACAACHNTQKVCDSLGKKDKDAWTQTVNRMVKKGAAIDKDSIPAVVNYLAGLKPGTKPLCK